MGAALALQNRQVQIAAVTQITPQMRVLVAIEPVNFCREIDGLARMCRTLLSADPLEGTMFVFRCRSAKSIKLPVYDGQGFWSAQKRMSTGSFRHWPTATDAASPPLRRTSSPL